MSTTSAARVTDVAKESLGLGGGRPGDDSSPGGPSTARITMWIIGGAVGLYMVVTGVVGALTAG